MRSLIAWSRLFIDQEVFVALNTDEAQSVTAYSTLAPTFRVEGATFRVEGDSASFGPRGRTA